MGLPQDRLPSVNTEADPFSIATIPQFIPDGDSTLAVGPLLAAVFGGERSVRVVDAVDGMALVAMGVRLALAHC